MPAPADARLNLGNNKG